MREVFCRQINYFSQVQKIPETFGSVSSYLNSFITPLIEETHSDLCSSLKGVSRAPLCEIIKVERDTRNITNDLRKLIWFNNKSDDVEDEEEEKSGKYVPEAGDLFALMDIKPKRIDDLNRPGRFYQIAYACGPKDSYADEIAISILSSKVMEMDILNEIMSNKSQKLYAVFLLNLTTNIRVWNALTSLWEDDNLTIIKQVLQPEVNVRFSISPSVTILFSIS